jgi:hypothetical protein
LKSWEPSQHLLIDTGKPRKTCVEGAGRRTFRILTSSQQSGIQSRNSNTHIVQQIQEDDNNTHKTATTIHKINQQQLHTRQLQQYKRPTNNNTQKTTTTIHKVNQQQLHKDNYNNTRKTTTIQTANQQYTRDNYNNTQGQPTTIHKDNYTIHTKQLQQYTQDI